MGKRFIKSNSWILYTSNKNISQTLIACVQNIVVKLMLLLTLFLQLKFYIGIESIYIKWSPKNIFIFWSQ